MEAGSSAASPSLLRRALVPAVAVALAAVLFGQAFGTLDDGAAADVKVLIGPTVISNGGYLQLERHYERIGPLPRLRIVAPPKHTDADGDLALEFFTKVMNTRRPFVVVWDVRRVAFPRITGKQFQAARAWVGEFVVAWDTHAQAHVIILNNPLIRGILSLMLRIFRPPQPVHVAKDDQGAREFTRRCCHQIRSYVKASYEDREERHKLFFGIGG